MIRARKVGGSYEAMGYIVSFFTTIKDEPRVVFEFEEPPGLLHIFRPDQLEIEGHPLPANLFKPKEK